MIDWSPSKYETEVVDCEQGRHGDFGPVSRIGFCAEAADGKVSCTLDCRTYDEW